MRAVHRYYKHHYNKILRLRGYEDTLAPCVDKIAYCYESLSKKKVSSTRQSIVDEFRGNFQKYCINHDIDELSMTKDVLDFDKYFLRHLKTSIEK